MLMIDKLDFGIRYHIIYYNHATYCICYYRLRRVHARDVLPANHIQQVKVILIRQSLDWLRRRICSTCLELWLTLGDEDTRSALSLVLVLHRRGGRI